MEVSPDFRYVRLAADMETKIRSGVYRVGEKLPSLRKLHNHTGYSLSTVYHAYIELEKRELVEARQKSGYYVKARGDPVLPAPKWRKHRAKPKKVTINNLVGALIDAMNDPSVLQIGGAVPSPHLLPAKGLLRSLKGRPSAEASRLMTTYCDPQGSEALRRQIAKRMLGIAPKVNAEDIMVTNGCLEAISLGLRAVAKPGDTVMVESPTFPCFLQLIEDLSMFALEIPTDPGEGVDFDSLESALAQNRVAAFISMGNFQNPLGFCMTQEKKQRIVELLNFQEIPIIEDDIYGELYFGHTRPATLKTYDRKDLVIYCASFSKSLAPGLRIGWMDAGRFRDRVKQLKINTSITSPKLNQDIIAAYLQDGAYDRHLRRLRNALKTQVSNTAMAIARHFPADTKVTAPQGGLILWVQLNSKIDSMAVFHAAGRRNISILPGMLCSTTPNYRNCIRISCGYPWDEKIENGIAQLGAIIHSML